MNAIQQRKGRADILPASKMLARLIAELIDTGKDYLNNASWRERTTMTQYLSDLIEADKKYKTMEGESNV